MANRTVNQLPGTLDRTTIAGADKLLVDDVSDLETKSIIVDELTAHITAQTTAQQTYDAGAAPSITVGARGPLQLRTPTPDGSDAAITTYADNVEAASLTPAGLTSVQPLTVGPAPQPAGNDGWPLVLHGGDGGAGASFGGTVQVQAGEVLGGGGADGDVLIGTEHASAIQIGKTGDGSSVQITGDLTVASGSGGNKTAWITAAAAASDAVMLDATDPAGGVSLRVEGTEIIGVGAAQVQIKKDATVAGTLKRKIAVRTVTTSTVLTAADQVVLVDASGGPITLTAPDPADLYEPILILKKSTGANAINIATPSGQINGAASPQALPDSTSTLRPSWTLLTDGTDTWSA